MAQEQKDESVLILVYDIISNIKSIQDAMDDAYDNGYGLISFPFIDPKFDDKKLIHSKYDMNENKNDNDDVVDDNMLSNIPFIYSNDCESGIFQSVYGKISKWITFDENNNNQQNIAINTSYEQMLIHQLNWSQHLGIFSVILPSPLQPNNTNNNNNNANDDDEQEKEPKNDNNSDLNEIPIRYASSLITAFKSNVNMIGIIPISLSVNGLKLWQSLSILLRDIKTIRPGLIIEKNLPSKEIIEQFYAEGVQIFFLNENVFLTNKKGYPVLSRPHQKLLSRFMRETDMTVIIEGEPELPQRYSQYLRHIRGQSAKLTAIEYEEKPFWDVLQTPLQPLSHNLEFSTYETFENDEIKYIQYEKAIIKCLIDLDKKLVLSKKNKNKNTNNNKKNKNDAIVVMVLGAGRGPLVTASLNASKSTGIKIRVYAIEKNPHAMVILNNKNKYEWKNAVNIVQQDMRTWDYPEKAHIIISELLGSFGDNELSPECLDGALKRDILHGNVGVCIPSKYTSYLCPITNNSVYSRLTEKPKEFEIPYVIHLKRHIKLSEIKQCWSFSHSVKDNKKIMSNNSHNSRYCRLDFKLNHNNAVVHGFAGYFDTVLYDDIILSTNPNKNATKNMYSWFPIYFPLITPIKMNNNNNLSVSLWRKTNEKCIWYEWCVTNPILTQIHNPSHRSYQVDLH